MQLWKRFDYADRRWHHKGDLASCWHNLNKGFYRHHIHQRRDLYCRRFVCIQNVHW